jgi:aquaporin Z
MPTNLLDPKYIAEFIGTLCLVMIGCGAVAIGTYPTAFPVGILPIALAFGLTVTAMAYTIGPISGAHVNPAVTVSLWVAGRIKTEDVAGYIIAQIIGGIVGAAILVIILKGKLSGYDLSTGGLGQNGWGEGYAGGYGIGAAIVTEFVATLVFTLVILGSTSGKGATPFAGLAIGLTLAILHVTFLNVTGLSVNPARSLGPAVFVGGHALAQVWLFLIVPTIAGAVAGWLVKSRAIDI